MTGCALCKSGKNHYGQLGLGDLDNRGDDENEMGDYLDVLQFGDNFTPNKLAAGGQFACALSVENTIKCWGLLSDLLCVCSQ